MNQNGLGLDFPSLTGSVNPTSDHREDMFSDWVLCEHEETLTIKVFLWSQQNSVISVIIFDTY